MSLLEDIARGEPYDLEFKLIPNEERIKYLKTVVAFANGRGGRLLLGVDNDRTVHGIANGRVYAELDGITNSISDDRRIKALCGVSTGYSPTMDFGRYHWRMPDLLSR